MRKRAGEGGTEEPEGGLSSGCILPYSFTYLLNKYLLSTDYLPDTVTGTVDTAMIKTDEDSCFIKFTLGEVAEDKQSTQHEGLFSGGPGMSLPASERDTGSVFGLGRCHMLRSN